MFSNRIPRLARLLFLIRLPDPVVKNLKSHSGDFGQVDVGECLFVYCLSLFLFLFFVCQQTIPCRQVVVTLAMAGAPWGLASWGERRPAAQEGRARMELK